MIQDIYKRLTASKQQPTITTDSRNCPAGSIFFALKGTNFNGNDFAETALEKGCSYAVIDEPQTYMDNRYILVDNVLQTLQDLARYHRTQLQIPIIGITGTNGKTTTKELIAAVLRQKYKVHYTQGNLNNHIGVPLTILSIPSDCEIAVVEMGANHPDEIKTLSEIVMPTCGLITNVGKAHLEGFGSFEGVIRTKKELYDNITSRGGRIFINAADKWLTEALGNYNNKLTYSSNHAVNADITAHLTDCSPYVQFQWNNINVNTHFVGSYNLNNILAAIAIGHEFGVSDTDIAAAITGYIPSNNRSQLTKTDSNTLIIDAYNANPTSMAAAIDNFAQMKAEHKTVILGDMLELGSQSETEHQAIIARLKNTDIDDIILVGREFCKTADGYRCFADKKELKQYLIENRLINTTVLIKGSNGIGLQHIISLL